MTVSCRDRETPLVVSVLPAQRRFADELSSAMTMQSSLRAAASARELGLVTTGHAQRGVSGVPSPGATNLHLEPGCASPQELIAGIENGIYVVGDKSWSIDMQRYNFQFTGQRFFRIKNGRLDGQLKDVAYQATTTDFWNSMEAVGGPQTYVLGGAFNCGKGQPGQIAPVSHGAPAALFRQVRILNTAEEGK